MKRVLAAIAVVSAVLLTPAAQASHGGVCVVVLGAHECVGPGSDVVVAQVTGGGIWASADGSSLNVPVMVGDTGVGWIVGGETQLQVFQRGTSGTPKVIVTTYVRPFQSPAHLVGVKLEVGSSITCLGSCS